MSGRRLAALAEIPPGEGRTMEVDGTRIAVFRTRDGGVFATDAACPHRGGPLADGLTDAGVVICPLHDHAFDLRTGAGVNSGCGITVYPVRIVQDWIELAK